MCEIFFTSDTHFNHEKNIEYNKRPFQSIEEHDSALIERWNSVVGENDVVYHLGDFVFGGSAVWHDIRSRLNGKIHLVLGNHDRKNFRKNFSNMFESVSEMCTHVIGDRTVIMCHYPLLCFKGSDNRFVIQLYGHVHSGPKCTTDDLPRLEHCFRNQYDVGVDNNDYRPVNIEEVKRIIDARFVGDNHVM